MALTPLVLQCFHLKETVLFPVLSHAPSYCSHPFLHFKINNCICNIVSAFKIVPNLSLFDKHRVDYGAWIKLEAKVSNILLGHIDSFGEVCDHDRSFIHSCVWILLNSHWLSDPLERMLFLHLSLSEIHSSNHASWSIKIRDLARSRERFSIMA